MQQAKTDYILHDSGQRQEFSTGAHRDTQTGKGRFDLLPPGAIQRLARHFEKGALKYSPRNWEKGLPISRFLDSALRHTFSYMAGKDDEDHLVAAAWNLLAALETERRALDEQLPRELVDIGPHQHMKEQTTTTDQPLRQPKKRMDLQRMGYSEIVDYFCPHHAKATHSPGTVLKEFLNVQGMRVEELARRAGISVQILNKFIAGTHSLKRYATELLYKATGIQADIWTLLDCNYREHRAAMRKVMGIKEGQS
jgi:plasmid maintenance system antidote protein VapI